MQVGGRNLSPKPAAQTFSLPRAQERRAGRAGRRHSATVVKNYWELTLRNCSRFLADILSMFSSFLESNSTSGADVTAAAPGPKAASTGAAPIMPAKKPATTSPASCGAAATRLPRCPASSDRCCADSPASTGTELRARCGSGMPKVRGPSRSPNTGEPDARVCSGSFRPTLKGRTTPGACESRTTRRTHIGLRTPNAPIATMFAPLRCLVARGLSLGQIAGRLRRWCVRPPR